MSEKDSDYDERSRTLKHNDIIPTQYMIMNTCQSALLHSSKNINNHKHNLSQANFITPIDEDYNQEV